MNNLKKISITLIVLLLSSTFIYSQDIGQGEFMIVNQTNSIPITVKIYPVGAIFNGADQYTVIAANKINPQNNFYIFGKELPISYDQNGNDWYKRANFDKSPNFYQCDFSLGYGRYRIDFYEGTTKTNTCDVDFSDANFTGQDVSGYIQHLRVDYYSSSEITFQFINPNSENVSIAEVNNYIKVWEQVGTGNSALTPSKGNFTDSQDPAAQYHAFPLDATAFGHFAHVTPEEVKLSLKITNYDANLSSDKTLNFKNCIYTIEAHKTFTMNGNSLTIEGEGGKFVSGNNSIFNSVSSQSLNIMNGASIESYGTIFTSSSGYWEGINLSRSNPSIIDYCTFNNSNHAILLSNHGYANITNNTFHVPELSYATGISLYKIDVVSIVSNHFILQSENSSSYTRGIDFVNVSNSEEENNDAPWYRFNILGNDFHNGKDQIFIFSPEYIQNIYVKDNRFYDGAWNMWVVNSNGRILDNHFYCNTTNVTNTRCIALDHSNHDLLNNEINSVYTNMETFNNSYPNLEPAIYDNHYFWRAGKNKFNSNLGWNIYSSDYINPGFFYTNFGKNEFNIGQPFYHLKGYLDKSTGVYNTNGNCWTANGVPIESLTELKRPDNSAVKVNWQTPYPNCNWNEQLFDKIITDRGNGIYDTILITESNNIPILSEDISLFGIGVKDQTLKNYSSAISSFKNLVTNYPDSKYLEKSIFNLYECYTASDTNHNQGWRNVIFNDFKNYLENKIQQYQSNDEFVNVAFDFLLKSKIKIKGYRSAMDGYEFIVNNSPSASERLMASINYIDVEGLLQGSSGGQNENKDYPDELSSDRNGKPIKDILLASYKKTNAQIGKREKSDLKNSSDVTTTKAALTKKHSFDRKLEIRALENISISGSLTKKERIDRIQKDLMLLNSRGESTEKVVKKENTTPIKYELSQNYPNPFNPVTNIKYQIQKTGLVTQKFMTYQEEKLKHS